MKKLLAIALLGALAATVAEDIYSRERVRALFNTTGHCGCVNRDRCTEPCVACCGEGGYAACFSNSPECRGCR